MIVLAALLKQLNSRRVARATIMRVHEGAPPKPGLLGWGFSSQIVFAPVGVGYMHWNPVMRGLAENLKIGTGVASGRTRSSK